MPTHPWPTRSFSQLTSSPRQPTGRPESAQYARSYGRWTAFKVEVAGSDSPNMMAHLCSCGTTLSFSHSRVKVGRLGQRRFLIHFRNFISSTLLMESHLRGMLGGGLLVGRKMVSFHRATPLLFVWIRSILFCLVSFRFIAFCFVSFRFASLLHFASFRPVSFRSISFRLVLFCFLLFHFASFRLVSYRFLSLHFVSFRFVLFSFATSVLSCLEHSLRSQASPFFFPLESALSPSLTLILSFPICFVFFLSHSSFRTLRQRLTWSVGYRCLCDCS